MRSCAEELSEGVHHRNQAPVFLSEIEDISIWSLSFAEIVDVLWLRSEEPEVKLQDWLGRELLIKSNFFMSMYSSDG